MTLKQKIYNFLAIINDYKGLHWSANAYRNDDESIIYATFDLLTVWIFPIGVLFTLIATKRFHSPNCDCESMQCLRIK